MSEIKPCPHHEQAIYPHRNECHYATVGLWRVDYVCPECGCSFSDTGDTEQEADERAARGWNERHEQTCHMVFYDPKEPKCQCDACGLGYSIGHDIAWHGNRFVYLWGYCKNCGARVVDDDAR